MGGMIMAMLSNGGYGPRSYAYGFERTYTLEQAVDIAIGGGVDPREVYRQMPKLLQDEVDRITRHQFPEKCFMFLTMAQQQEVMSTLKQEMKRAKDIGEKPLSIPEALSMAMDGTVDDIRLYNALPDAVRQAMDGLARNDASVGFCDANPTVRRQVLAVLLEMLRRDGGEDVAKPGATQIR